MGPTTSDGRPNELPAAMSEKTLAPRARADPDSVPQWTLEVYLFKCGEMIDVCYFEAIAEDGQNLVAYDRICFECDTALRAWKRRWVLLSRWCVGVLIDTCFSKTFFVRS